ncbi:hypothetical protein ES705_44268 [subsurface metagenome]
MNKTSNYGEMLIKYRGKWVALSHDESKVIASGKNLLETIKKTKKIKEKEPIYVMVSEKVGSFSF